VHGREPSSERLFLRGWTKAQEGAQAASPARPLWERGLGVLTAVFPLQTAVLVVKE
jgi:hypothetical protein